MRKDINKNVINVNGTPEETLAVAIVQKAIEDYKKAVRLIEHEHCTLRAEREIAEIERFIKSKWFKALTAIDPNWLLDKLHN